MTLGHVLLLADGVRFFEPARDAAIEFIFTMDRQVIAIASWITRHGLPRSFFWSGAIRNPRSEIRNSPTSDLCWLNYSHSIVLGGLLEIS
jgi:hypothetical protein